METIKVNQKNIDCFNPYQGQNKKLEIGQKLFVVKSNVPCITINKTFSIVTDKKACQNTLFIAKRDNKEIHIDQNNYYNANRWSIIKK